MKFKNRIILSVLVITFIPLLISYSIFLSDKISDNSVEVENNLYEVAELVVSNPEIRERVEKREFDGFIEERAEEYIKIFRDVDIIVVADTDGKKYSHLDKSQIGKNFVNPVQWNEIRSGNGYFSKMQGSMGVTFRRFEPIHSLDNNNIIGFVMVGKYYDTIFKTTEKTILMFLLLFLGAFIMAFLLALTFAERMKKQLFGLAPEEIGRLYNEERLIIDNLESGLIALDSKNSVLKVNDVFSKKYSKFTPYDIIEKIERYLESKENRIRGREVLIGGERLYIKILPIYNGKEYFGSTLLIKKHEVVDSYAREITGIDQLVEGMRANIHEFKNRLHVILGLINLEKLDMAKKYILEVQELNEYDFKKYKNIKNSFVKAMLLGKDAVAKERKIEIVVDPETSLTEEKRTELMTDLTTILGNLLENALDSFRNINGIKKEIRIKMIETMESIYLEVWDNGEKIPDEIISKIYDYGFSSKGTHRGVGLSLVKEKLDLHNGSISLEQWDEWKVFRVRMNKNGEDI